MWHKEARKLGKDGNPVGATAKLDFYVYGIDTPAADAPDTNDQRRSVNTARAAVANEVIDRAVDQGTIPPPGPIRRTLFTHHLASLPTMPEPENIRLPDTNTFRQAHHLDDQRLAYDTMSEEQRRVTESETRPMRCVIHVNMHDLRAILRLPFFDMSALHIFAHPTTPVPAPLGHMADEDQDQEIA